MADYEKVIKGMEMCISPDECSPDECPYYIRPNNESGLCWDRLMTDAIALLKEQEAEPMIEDEHGWNCPSCGMKLIGKTASGYPCDLIDLPEDEPIHFCPNCGQAVKWE